MSCAETSDVAPPDIPHTNKCVAIIYTMADVQSMDTPSWIKTCKDLSASSFHCIYTKKIDEYNELHIVFDRYEKKQQDICGLAILTLWHITAQTLQVFHVPLIAHLSLKTSCSMGKTQCGISLSHPRDLLIPST